VCRKEVDGVGPFATRSQPNVGRTHGGDGGGRGKLLEGAWKRQSVAEQLRAQNEPLPARHKPWSESCPSRAILLV
jgi:hypothetical protein